ncbi:MAG: HD domain-containing protein [Nitrosopumilaceae archaeon]|nr:HD domain-containing protein [Nitrosopumilaceae archaeon]
MILDFFKTAANLKEIPRQGWMEKLEIDNPESVADHTYSMALIGMVLSESKNLNTEKILKMILLHDLAESIVGDYTPEQKPKKEKINLEINAFEKIVNYLPSGLKKQYTSIWNEYLKNESREAVFVHQIDKLEMALQASIYLKKFPEKKLEPFFNSAENEITDPNLLTLFDQIKKY